MEAHPGPILVNTSTPLLLDKGTRPTQFAQSPLSLSVNHVVIKLAEVTSAAGVGKLFVGMQVIVIACRKSCTKAPHEDLGNALVPERVLGLARIMYGPRDPKLGTQLDHPRNRVVVNQRDLRCHDTFGVHTLIDRHNGDYVAWYYLRSFCGEIHCSRGCESR